MTRRSRRTINVCFQGPEIRTIIDGDVDNTDEEEEVYRCIVRHLSMGTPRF